MEQLELEVRELMGQAERAGQGGGDDGQNLPKELSRHKALKEKLEAARRRIEERAKKKAQAEQAEYERKVREGEERGGSARGRHIQPPDPTPPPEEQENLTDPHSRLCGTTRKAPTNRPSTPRPPWTPTAASSCSRGT